MPHEGNRLNKEPSLVSSLPNRMLTAEEVATYLGVPKQRIYALTHTHEIPYHKIGRSVRFNIRDIDDWLEAQRVPVIEKQTIQKLGGVA